MPPTREPKLIEWHEVSTREPQVLLDSTMGRRKQPLADFWEEEEGGKLRCLVCKGLDPNHKSISRASRTEHERGATHKRAQVYLRDIEEVARREREMVDSAYADSRELTGVRLADGDIESVSRPGMVFPASGPTPWDNEFGFGDEHQLGGKFLTREAEDLRILDELEQWGQYLHDDADLDEPFDDDNDLGLADEEDEAGVEGSAPGFETYTSPFDRNATNWAPYKNKTMLLVDVLDNLPRLRTSRRLMEMILWVMKNIDPKDVPSWKQLRRTQEKLKKFCGGIETKKYVSSVGNIMYLNDIASLVAKDYANPETAHLLQFYPEEAPDGVVSEIWHGTKLRELPQDLLTPMFRKGFKDFYVDELTELASGELVVPEMWIIRGGRMTADARRVRLTTAGYRVDEQIISVPADDMKYNYLDLLESGVIRASAQIGDKQMPNPLRTLAEGEELFSDFMFFWADDVSGNKTKMINAHKNLYASHGNMPGRLLQQEYFVRFVSTSPYAGTPEQFEAVKDMLDRTHQKPLRTYKADTGRMCRSRIIAVVLPADNPQQSELSSHIGPKGNCGCRKCWIGGTGVHKESDEGFHALHSVGDARVKEDTIASLKEQVECAIRGDMTALRKLQTATGVKDTVTEQWISWITVKRHSLVEAHETWEADKVTRAVADWMKDQCEEPWSPLLRVRGLDPHTNTPVEILHTILLGVVKYMWMGFHAAIKEKPRELFVIRLQSTDTSGLAGPPIQAAYMNKYRNALIGKHYKTIMQTIVFHVHGLVDDPIFQLIRATGALGALLWYHEIRDLELYLDDLKILIDNLLDAFDKVGGHRIVNKQKIHLLTHLIEDIRRFGPAIRFATEIYECFNAVFRLCSILSNHQAPGHDIARKMSSMERVKHTLSGGFWASEGKWVQAGPGVRELLLNTPQIQHHLGWVPPKKFVPGAVTLVPAKQRRIVTWAELGLITPTCGAIAPAPPSLWRKGATVTTDAGDICEPRSWVFYRHPEVPHPTVVGRIAQIWSPGDPQAPSGGLIIIDHFPIHGTLHPIFEMPILAAPSTGPTVHIVSAQDIRFDVNVQHDCRRAKCGATGTKIVRQERTKTTRTVQIIEHIDDTNYILNMHSIHHAEMVRRVLPRELTRPVPLHLPDVRRTFHDQVAACLRVSQDAKRAKRNAKAQETRAAKQTNKKIPNNGKGKRNPEPDATSDDADRLASESPPPRVASKRTVDAWSSDEADQELEHYGSDEDADAEFDGNVPIRSRNARTIKKPRLWVPGE